MPPVSETAVDIHHRRGKTGGMQPSHAIARRKEQVVDQAHRRVQQIAVQEGDSLGPAGAAGRVEDVGPLQRVAGYLQVRGLRVALDPRRVDDAHPLAGQFLREPHVPIVCQQDGGLGILQHDPQAFFREIRIERHIGLVRLQGCQNGKDHFRRIGLENGRLGQSLAGGRKDLRRDRVGEPIRLGVRVGHVSRPQSDVHRVQTHLLLEALVDALLNGFLCGIPRSQGDE